jgi:DNA invertase Pin-like site-specific DNA recombinase
MGGTVAPEDVSTDVVSASKFSKKERKDYLRLLAAIEAPDGPRIVVAWMEDRAHRQVLELAEFIDICREHGVRVATPAAEYDLDDPDAVSLWFIKVRFAEAEVEKTSKRLRRQRQQAAEKGYPQVAVLATSASRSGSRAKTAGWCPATPFPCLASGRSRS